MSHEALGRLVEQGYTPEQARSIVAGIQQREGCPYGGPAWHRAVVQLASLYPEEYNRLLAKERGE